MPAATPLASSATDAGRSPSRSSATLRPTQVVAALDSALAIGLAALVAVLAVMFGGVTPAGHLAAVGMGSVLALLATLRVALSRQVNWCWTLVPAVLFAGLVALQTIEFDLGTFAALQDRAAATWRDLLGDPSSPAAAEALKARPLSLQPGATVEQLRLLLVGLVLLWCGAQLAAAEQRALKLLLGCLAAVGSGVALVGVAQVVSGTEAIWWTFEVGSGPKTGGPFVHRGHFAQFVNLGLGAVLALLFVRLSDRSPNREHRLEELFQGVTQPGRRTDLLLLIAAVVCLAAVGLSQARNGVISALVAGVVLALFVGRTRYLKGVGWPLFGMLLAAFAAVLVMGFDPVYERFANLPEEIDEREYGRVAIWRDAVALWEAYPTFGAGFGSFESTFPAFDTATRRGTVAHAESLYVEVLAETGWVGALLMLLAVAGVVWSGVRRALRIEVPAQAAVFGMGFGLVAVAFHQTTDFGAKTPAVAAFALVSAGVVLGLGSRQRVLGGPAVALGLGLTPPLLAALALAVPSAARAWQRAGLAEQAEELRERRGRGVQVSIRSAEAYARELELLDSAYGIGESAQLHAVAEDAYWRAATHWRKAVAEALEAGREVADREDFEGDRAILQALRAEGRDAALRSAAREASDILLTARIDTPTHGRAWALYGELGEDWLGDARAIEWLGRAARLAPHDPIPCLAYGRGLLKRGEMQPALHWLRRAVAMGSGTQEVLAMLMLEFGADDLALQVAQGDPVSLRTLHSLIERIQRAANANDALANAADRAAWLQAFDAARLERLAEVAGVCRRETLEILTARAGAGESLNPSWLALLATYHDAEGHDAEAAQAYARVLSLVPQNDQVRTSYALVLERLGDFESAERQAERVLRARPNDRRARELLDRLRAR